MVFNPKPYFVSQVTDHQIDLRCIHDKWTQEFGMKGGPVEVILTGSQRHMNLDQIPQKRPFRQTRLPGPTGAAAGGAVFDD